jgi:hypothetical protein
VSLAKPHSIWRPVVFGLEIPQVRNSLFGALFGALFSLILSGGGIPLGTYAVIGVVTLFALVGEFVLPRLLERSHRPDWTRSVSEGGSDEP